MIRQINIRQMIFSRTYVSQYEIRAHCFTFRRHLLLPAVGDRCFGHFTCADKSSLIAVLVTQSL